MRLSNSVLDIKQDRRTITATSAIVWHIPICQTFLLALEDVSPFRGATNTSVLDLRWHAWRFKTSLDPLLACFVVCKQWTFQIDSTRSATPARFLTAKPPYRNTFSSSGERFVQSLSVLLTGTSTDWGMGSGHFISWCSVVNSHFVSATTLYSD